MFTFTTDDHYLIGDAHSREGKPCQDHALSGIHGETAFAVVSDGCSSGRHTDVGSRLVSLTLSSAVCRTWDVPQLFTPSSIARLQDDAIKGLANQLMLEDDDLLATSAYVALGKTGGFAHLRGDGVLALKRNDGSILLSRFDWDDNMPFYPAYGLKREDAFIAAHGGDVSVSRLIETRWAFTFDTGLMKVATVPHSLAEGMSGIIVPLPSVRDIAFAAVFSDGVTQVDGIDWKDAVLSLLAFKSTEGVFAKRRLIRFVQDARKRGRGPIDDIAFAVIHVVHEETED